MTRLTFARNSDRFEADDTVHNVQKCERLCTATSRISSATVLEQYIKIVDDN
jgi:hypothetical protein